MSRKSLRAAPFALAAMAALSAASFVQPAAASSHREAPFITTVPKVDGTDFYMFRSYEPGRDAFVTLVANYIPLQDAYGGPNYFSFDPNALYEIHIDNNGNGVEDITFQFRFKNNLTDITLPIAGKNISIPLVQAGAISASSNAALNLKETYQIDIVRGDRRSGQRQAVTSAGGGAIWSSRSTSSALRPSIRSPATKRMQRRAFKRSTFRVAPRRARCSSASAKIRSWSPWERRSTC